MRDPGNVWDCGEGDCIEKPQTNTDTNCNKESLVYRAGCILCEDSHIERLEGSSMNEELPDNES